MPRLPIDRDMYRYIPPCLDLDVLAIAGSRSSCILAQGMPIDRDVYRYTPASTPLHPS